MSRAWYGAYPLASAWGRSPVNLEIDCSHAGDHGNLDDCVINYSVVRALGGYFGQPCEHGAVMLACDAEDLEYQPYTPTIDVFDLDMGINIGADMEAITNICEYEILSTQCWIDLWQRRKSNFSNISNINIALVELTEA